MQTYWPRVEGKDYGIIKVRHFTEEYLVQFRNDLSGVGSQWAGVDVIMVAEVVTH